MYYKGMTIARRYRMEVRIGIGAMGEVWRATDTTLGRTVAIKAVRPALRDNPELLRRFSVEAAAMASLRHPGIVAVYDTVHTASDAFLVMEYVDGESLAAMLARGRISPKLTMDLVAQAAEALHAAHERGIVHRDVKPANLLIRDNDKLKLTDFGVARLLDGTQATATGMLVGTTSYLSPEQIRGHPATARSDIYALGVVAYECLMGRRPFDRENPAATMRAHEREAPATLPSTIPPAVVDVTERALAKDPADRWESAASLAAACRRAAPSRPRGGISMGTAIGIDLGTTFSAAAVVRDGQPELLVNSDGGYLTPSVVLFQPDGEPLVGELAARSASEAPDDCVQFVKRHMGDPTWSVVDPGGTEYRPEQVSAMILRRLAQDAATALGEPVHDVVITVPAYFDDARRTATRQAGEIADLRVLRLVNEPTAAAVGYGYARQQVGTFLTYDLGGGTFDVTVLRARAGEFTVLATEGDRNLGGFDFDNALMTWVAKAVQDQGGPDLLDEPALTARLRADCELAKRRLSAADQANILVTAQGRSFRIRVTRADFEAMTRDLLERTEIILEGVLNDAGLGWDQIDQMLLVGGSTRMPMVHDLLRRLSGKPPATGVHPDQVVALGAAIMADQARAEATETLPTLAVTGSGHGGQLQVRDVTSQALGTTVLVDKITRRVVNDIIIPRNTPIPHQAVKTYYTVDQNQRSILADITEGDSEDPQLVTKLIERNVPLPAGLPEDAPIRHIMRYDADGLVHLELFDETNGQHLGEVELDRPLNLAPADVHRMRRAMRDLEVQ